MKLIGLLICKLQGKHKRGKLARTEGGDGTGLPAVRVMACPRCGRETRYQVKAAA